MAASGGAGKEPHWKLYLDGICLGRGRFRQISRASLIEVKRKVRGQPLRTCEKWNESPFSTHFNGTF